MNWMCFNTSFHSYSYYMGGLFHRDLFLEHLCCGTLLCSGFRCDADFVNFKAFCHFDLAEGWKLLLCQMCGLY